MAWTEKEKQLLIDNYLDKTDKELMILLNKTSGQLRGMKSRLGLNSKLNTFSDKEKEIITNYYKNHNDEDFNLDELSVLIRRSKTSICRFAKTLNLTNANRNASSNKKDKIKEGVYSYMNSEKYTEEIKENRKELLTYYAQNDHPKGMLGKRHSEDSKNQMSKAHIEFASHMSNEEKHEIAMKAVQTRIQNGGFSTTSNAYSRTKGGKRRDLNNQFFRSSWEANIARVLDYENIEWTYETQRFFFKENVNGVLSYQPDFYLPQFDKWIEVKGWMDEKSEIRLRLFEEQYPEENKKLILIDESFYNDLYTEFDFLPNWEPKSKKVAKQV